MKNIKEGKLKRTKNGTGKKVRKIKSRKARVRKMEEKKYLHEGLMRNPEGP